MLPACRTVHASWVSRARRNVVDVALCACVPLTSAPVRARPQFTVTAIAPAAMYVRTGTVPALWAGGLLFATAAHFMDRGCIKYYQDGMVLHKE